MLTDVEWVADSSLSGRKARLHHL